MTFVRGSERLHGNPRARQTLALHPDIDYLAGTVPETPLRGWIEYFLSAKDCYRKPRIVCRRYILALLIDDGEPSLSDILTR